MTLSTAEQKRPKTSRIMRATQEATQVLDRVPGARQAIQERIQNDPEYRRWLQQFGQGVLQAVG